MSILDGLARYLDDQGLVTYDPTGTSGDVFVSTMPQTPDAAVALFTYGGPEPSAALLFDEPSVQAMVRSGADPRPALDRANAIRTALHGLANLTLPDGTYVVQVIGVQSAPVYAGADDGGRHRYTVNLRTSVTRS